MTAVSPVLAATEPEDLVRSYRFEFIPEESDATLSDYVQFLGKTSPGLEGLRARYAVADLLMRQGRHAEASPILQELSGTSLSDDYFNGSVLLKLAECHMYQAQYPQAYQAYSAVQRGAVKALFPDAILGMAVSALAVGDRDKAYLHFQELTAFYPAYKERTHLMLPLGLILWEMNKFQEALSFFLRDEANPASIYFAGLCHRELKQPAKALAAFRRLVADHHGSVWSDRGKFELGETFYQGKDFTLASKSFAELQADRPPRDIWSSLALYRLACAEMQTGRPKDAEEKLWTLQQTKGENLLFSNVTYLLAETLADQKKIEKVIDLLRKDATARNRSPENLYRLIWALTATGKYDEAIKLSNDYLNAGWDPELTPKTLLVQSHAYEQKGRVAEAAAGYQLVVEHFNATPYAARSLQLMAMAFYRQAQYDPIITQVNHGWNTLDPAIQKKHPEPLFWIAEARLKQGDGPGAAKYFKSFSDAAPASHPLMAQALQGQAVGLAMDRRFDEAVAVLQKGYQTATEAKETLLASQLAVSLGGVYFNAKDYENAATFYRQLEKLDPKHPQTPFVLYQCGLALYRAEYYSDAVASWKRLAQEFPKHEKAPEALFRAAKTTFDLGHYPEAVSDYETLIAKYPKDDFAKDARLQIGQCHYNAGAYDKAILAYTDFLDRYPADPQAVQVTALLQTAYYQAKKTPEEIERLTQGQPKSAVLADIYWEQGAKLYNEKDYEKARAYFEKILYEFPSSSQSPQAAFYRAESIYLLEKHAEAVPAYENFLAQYPDDAQKSLAMFHLAVCLYNVEDYPKAARAFEAFAAGFPDDAMAKNAALNAAVAFAKAQDVDNTARAYLQYAVTYPDSEDAGAIYLQLGEFLDKAGETKKAAEAYAKTPPARTEYAQAMYSAAQAYRKLGDPDAEIRAYEALRGHNSKNDPYRISGMLQLAEIYLRKNDFKRAMSLYEDVAQNAEDQQSLALAKEQLKVLQEANP